MTYNNHQDDIQTTIKNSTDGINVLKTTDEQDILHLG